MSEEKILDSLEDEKASSCVKEKEPFSFKGFFKDIKNIYALIAVVFGLLAIVLFLVCPSIIISLTNEGKAHSQTEGYYQSLNGLKVLFGNGSYDVWVWHTFKDGVTEPVLSLDTEKLAFNAPILIGLLFMLAGMVMVVILTVLKKNNILNKIILALFIIATLMILLAPIWFYMVNPLLASTRYDTSASISPYECVNAHAGIGTILGALFGVIASVASGLLIAKPVETR